MTLLDTLRSIPGAEHGQATDGTPEVRWESPNSPTIGVLLGSKEVWVTEGAVVVMRARRGIVGGWVVGMVIEMLEGRG